METQYKPEEVLQRLRSEFDYLWEHYNRTDFDGIRLGDYCASLEVLIMNRLDEAGLRPQQFGTGGIAALDQGEGRVGRT